MEETLEELAAADPAQAPQLADAIADRLESELGDAGAPPAVADDDGDAGGDAA